MARTSLKERRVKDNKPQGVDTFFEPVRQLESTSEKKELSKITLYVRPDQVVSIERIQLAVRERTGKRPDKSDLIQEALDLLVKKYELR